MAFRATNQLRPMLKAMGSQSRSFASSATRKYATAAADAAMHVHEHMHQAKSKFPANGDWAPVMIMGGFLVTVVTLATHSAWQQLAYSPTVQLSKKKRETVPEVYQPDAVLGSSDKFINKSFLRKVAHIQDHKRTLDDPSRPNPFTHPRDIESLKSVGVRE
ncbi:uncharacterized protein LOC113782035 [Coffea eugenioides]|uniref:Uncharacterized protein n=1 Tax=Coffea arabica TaxID=13443 RepID=A0A6P6UIJ0_COFAR|nr:uncharacterized protein LOC113710672 [Coffea arabica]XP_027183748.1 uncharacterized protein LOC113782035 [Coffea eugenioides]